jgi:hypothetical protein
MKYGLFVNSVCIHTMCSKQLFVILSPVCFLPNCLDSQKFLDPPQKTCLHLLIFRLYLYIQFGHIPLRITVKKENTCLLVQEDKRTGVLYSPRSNGDDGIGEFLKLFHFLTIL